jgi:hypothetical protein
MVKEVVSMKKWISWKSRFVKARFFWSLAIVSKIFAVENSLEFFLHSVRPFF